MGEEMTVSPLSSMRDAGDQFVGVSAAPSESGLRLWGGDEFSFEDLLDLINPLQHIPIVSNLYRAATGDEIGAVARIFGGALLGGPIGAIAAVVNSAVESGSGKDLGEHALALLNGEESLGGGEAPLVASMADRGADPWSNGTTGVAPDADGGPVQTAESGVVEIEGLPWLREGMNDRGPVQTASLAGDSGTREIGANEPLPWLPAGSVSGVSVPPSPPGILPAAAVAGEGSVQRAVLERDGTETVVGGPGLADAMMGALDKYRAMMLLRTNKAVDSSV